MENIYETMWNENLKWLERSLAFYTNKVATDQSESNQLETVQAVYQLMLDNLRQAEKVYASKLGGK